MPLRTRLRQVSHHLRCFLVGREQTSHCSITAGSRDLETPSRVCVEGVQKLESRAHEILVGLRVRVLVAFRGVLQPAQRRERASSAGGFIRSAHHASLAGAIR